MQESPNLFSDNISLFIIKNNEKKKEKEEEECDRSHAIIPCNTLIKRKEKKRKEKSDRSRYDPLEEEMAQAVYY
jgi:DNA polymerase III delta subunit